NGREAGITMKVNSLVDEEVIDPLYDASRAGVPIDLVIRGMCALRPEVPGLSDRIKVRSILGRFLEHSRILSFRNDGSEQIWIGSGDMMHRNLDRRVEATVRIKDRTVCDELRWILSLATSDDVSCWLLGPDGTWTRRTSGPNGPLEDYQEVLIRRH